MTVNHTISVGLDYGAGCQFSCEMARDRLVACHRGPAPCEDLAAEVRRALEHPLDFPPFFDVIYPGDRIVLALDPRTPQPATLISEVWRVCVQRDVSPSDVCVLQPISLQARRVPDPRAQLPRRVAQDVVWKVHDPTEPADQTYLASTSGGDRVYLSRHAVEADVVIPIGPFAFDSVIGYQGTGSVLYPGLSSPDAIRRSHGQGHQELGPDEVRPLRQVIDEIAWLLGIQFVLQVVPSLRDGAAHVLAGAVDSVFRQGVALLNDAWRVQLDSRPDVVVVAIEHDSWGRGWNEFGAALDTARNLVVRGGKIVVLSTLDAECDQGLQLVCQAETPRDALKPLRKLAPVDLVPATQLVRATDWAHIYLVSRLDDELVEDMFLTPIADGAELQRLLDREGSCALVDGAQHSYGQVTTPRS